MKKIIIAVAAVAILLAGWFIADYMNNSDDMSGVEQQETALQHAQKHLDPNYVCPMHPQIVRNEPGTCPICGMDLVLVEQDEEEPVAEKKILYWVAPMDPSYRRDGPGKSPMGMDLVPVYDESAGVQDDGPVVKVSPAVVNNLGVRTAPVERGKLWRRIDTVGYVDFDESKLSHIHLRTDGWIERLAVESEGDRVKKGQRLFDVYSPTLVSAMEEYLQAVSSGSQRLMRASYDRLISLKISPAQIKAIEKDRKVRQTVSIYAPQDGMVSTFNVREGMYVQPAMEVMSLADLSSVWLLAEVFESQANWVEVGQSADVKLSFVPGRTWEGEVGYVYPRLEAKTRTLKVRLQFDNSEETLKPNMFATVSIYAGPKANALNIPREALIRTGREERVIIDKGKGRYAQRKVVAGIETGDRVEIIDGLQEGEQVVVSGQFLIDSEASLKASLMRMSEPSSGDMAEPKAEDEQAAMKMPVARAVVRKLMPEQGKVSLDHDPIPELGWPSMTMDFDLAKDVSVAELKEGDQIEITLMKGDQGYVISSIKALDGQEQ
jgi:Cu(I)/Ag(I) efflux system membrane fusion protein